jgi:tetratricopeptide (TPR) repeat protein
MKLLGALSLIGLLTILTGCAAVVSVHPLASPADREKPMLDPRLNGEWIGATPESSDDEFGKPESSCRIKISKPEAPTAEYKLEFPNPDTASSPTTCDSHVRYDFHLVPIGGTLFFDATFDDLKDPKTHRDSSDVAVYGAAPGHLLGQLWIQPDFVRVGLLNPDWLRDNWPKDSMEQTSLGDYTDVTALTNTTAELRDIFLRNANEATAFAPAFYLCRAGTDCTARAFEDQLTRTPDDPDTLKNAVDFYAGRGEYVRALGLLRQKIKHHPDPAEVQYELGRMLLLDRDFVGARQALASAKEPSSGALPSIADLIVRSYFLQGDYQGTIKAAKTLKPPAEKVSADPIVLGYFALLRLGRSKDAAVYLQEQTNAFVGPADDHLQLLQLAQRVGSFESPSDKDRAIFYAALRDIRDGKIDEAKSRLGILVAKLPKNDFYYCAGKIELERLPVKAAPK